MANDKKRKAAELEAKMAGGKGDVSKPPRVPPLNTKPTLKDMLDMSLFQAGKPNVLVQHEGKAYQGVLMPDGSVVVSGNNFPSADAFATAVKRTTNPQAPMDDGMACMTVDGTLLGEWRNQYLFRQAAAIGKALAACAPEYQSLSTLTPADIARNPQIIQVIQSAQQDIAAKDAAAAAAPAPAPAATKAAANTKASKASKVEEAPVPAEGAAEEEEEETDQWVQCSRCNTWRIVPDEFWEDIQDAGDDPWYCKDALWDVTELEPFTEACQ